MAWNIYDSTGVLRTVAPVVPTTSLTGVLQAAQEPAHTGDATNSAGSLALALATVNSNVGAFSAADLTVNGKGLITAAASAAASGSGSLVRATAPTVSGLIGTGAADFSGASSFTLPEGATSVLDGVARWDTTNKQWLSGDGTQERGLSPAGWMHNVHPPELNLHATTTNTVAGLVAAGSMLIPLFVPANMKLISVMLNNGDTTLARTWGWDLYLDTNNASNTVTRVAASNGNESFTATAASNRTLAVSSGPVIIKPGLYWLVIQNRHATNTFGVTTQNAVTLVGVQPRWKAKTTTNPNGSTLDIIAATWAANYSVPIVYLNGSVAGDTVIW